MESYSVNFARIREPFSWRDPVNEVLVGSYHEAKNQQPGLIHH